MEKSIVIFPFVASSVALAGTNRSVFFNNGPQWMATSPMKRAGRCPRPTIDTVLSLLADAGIGVVLGTDVEASISRIRRRRLALFDIKESVNRLVTHVEWTLADIACSKSGL
jgi:hypothetical protein